jgi:hypothetical protein
VGGKPAADQNQHLNKGTACDVLRRSVDVKQEGLLAQMGKMEIG